MAALFLGAALFCAAADGAVLAAAPMQAGDGSGHMRQEILQNEETSGETERDTAPSPGELYAKSAALIDGDSGRLLYGKDADTPRPMASTTKIMTCILALEYLEQRPETALVSEYAASQPKVHLGAAAGESYYLKDLLYSLMLESHNDSAVIIAEHISGSVEEFAALMNRKARSLGCTQTYFITPGGLDAAESGKTHSTTARELALILKYCINGSEKSSEFLRITGTESYSFRDVSGKRSFSCTNHNAFLHMMEGALTGKTGFTGNAGYCYVGALRRDQRTLIVALLACGWPGNQQYKWADTRALMEYGLTHYRLRDLKDTLRLPELRVRGGIPEGNGLQVDPVISLQIKDPPESWRFLLREDEQAEILEEPARELKAPVKKGADAGTVRVVIGGEDAGIWELITSRGIKKRTYPWCLRQLLRRYLLVY